MSDAASGDGPALGTMPAGLVPARAATFALLALAAGSFGIGTGEFAIMGLLPDIADGLGISVPRAGGLISAYALGVVVGAPLSYPQAAPWRSDSCRVQPEHSAI